MLEIKNVRTLEGNIVNKTVRSSHKGTLDAEGRLTALPALIDPHVHFRCPGAEDKETWHHASLAAISGGVTTVFDMPNNTPSCITVKRLADKHKLIEQQLNEVGIPLRYHLYFGADQRNLEELHRVGKAAAAVKVFMGSSTGDLLMTDSAALDAVFRIAAEEGYVVAVHAEDEARLQQRFREHKGATDPATHSIVRDPQAAVIALQEASTLAEKYGTRLYALHLSCEEEIEVIRAGKARGVDIYAETTPHHLFLSIDDYAEQGTRVQMNPPLRTPGNHEVLWAAIADGTIDTIGSDHAPHRLEEKDQNYPLAPSGVPGVETTLPLLLNAYHEGKLSLQKIADLTRFNIEKLFDLDSNDDLVLVDLNKIHTVTRQQLHTRCQWSPFEGWALKGWPEYTILKGELYHVPSLHRERTAAV